jgi:hypothetical protein
MKEDPIKAEKEEKKGKKEEKKQVMVSGLSMKEIVEKVKEEICRYTGLPSSSILNVSQEEGGWRVGIEMVEKKSIPESQDILAHYEVRLDEKGQLIDFNRIKLRKRADTEGY